MHDPWKCLGVVVLAHTAAAFQLGAVLPSGHATVMLSSSDRVKLAGGLEVSPMGVGAWAWGDRLFWGYDDSQQASAQEAFNTAVDQGVNLFDTAEVYGAGGDANSWGYSEVLLSRFARQYQGDSEVLVATKFAPLPHRFLDGRKAVSKALRGSLQRLGADSCDIYQLHWPGFFADAAFWDGLADSYEAGLVRAVGVSNYSEKRLRAAHKALSSRGVPLATNQIQYSLLHRTPERGVLSACEDLGVKVLAYSPLAQGILTGRYSAQMLPSGPRGTIFSSRVQEVAPVVEALQRIGQAYGGKTPAQVALNWLMCKRVIPIPGARTRAQALENCGAMGWQLSPQDVATLDQLSKNCVQFPGMPLEMM